MNVPRKGSANRYHEPMTVRLTLTTTADEVLETYGLVDLPGDWRPRYNIAPTQPLLVVTDPSEPVARWGRWGLVPRWARDARVGARHALAPVSELEERSLYRSALLLGRCVVLADGFFAWAGDAERGQAHFFRHRGRRPFGIAAISTRWRAPEGVELSTCAIVTVPASDDVSAVTATMPAILHLEQWEGWLRPTDSIGSLLALLRPLEAGKLVSIPVGPYVNSLANDGPQCIEPSAP